MQFRNEVFFINVVCHGNSRQINFFGPIGNKWTSFILVIISYLAEYLSSVMLFSANKSKAQMLGPDHTDFTVIQKVVPYTKDHFSMESGAQLPPLEHPP